LQHRVVLSAERDYDRWVIRALAFMDSRSLGEHQLIQLAKAVGDFAAIGISDELAFLDVDAGHDAQIASSPIVGLFPKPLTSAIFPGCAHVQERDLGPRRGVI
jgi:hypothetical protein